jgi:putative membrane protein
MRAALPVLILQLGLTGPAMAHGGGGADAAGAWTQLLLDLIVFGPILALGVLYPRGLLRLWARAGAGRGVTYGQSAAFVAGLIVLLAALAPPLDRMSGESLTAHMIQHALLIALAPPLLLAGRPEAVVLWAMPASARRAFARSRAWGWLRRRLGWTLRPGPAAILHGAVLWIWHAPAAFQAALQHPALHVLEHATFVGTALLFWRSLVIAGRSRATVPAGAAAAFVTLLHGGFLGALMTFTPRPIYPWYAAGMADPLSDQQLAGLIMWVPLGAIYLLAGVMLLGRLIEAGDAGSDTPRRMEGTIGHAGTAETPGALTPAGPFRSGQR